MIDENELGSIDLLEQAVSLADSNRFGEMRDRLSHESEITRSAVNVIADDILELIAQTRKDAVGSHNSVS